jgi:8-oxo-dGTP diphosphatase
VREAREELGVEVELGAVLHEELFRGSRFLYFGARIVGGEFGTGEWPDGAASEPGSGGGTYEPVWLPLVQLAAVQVGLDVRPRDLVTRLSATP